MKYLKLALKTFPNFNLISYTTELEKAVKGCKTILDIGCGDNSPIRFLQGSYQTVGLDGYEQAIALSEKRNIHSSYIHADVSQLSKKIKPKSFDAVVALDLIEHLTKEGGYKFLKDCEKIAKKRIVIVTPNGFTVQHGKDKNNILQEHLSGWTTKDFENLGFKVTGLYGLKFIFTSLRADDGGCKYQPKLFWGLVGGLLAETTHHLGAKNNPENSFSLLAVKKLS